MECPCPSIPTIADDPRIIFSVYATAFVPLAFIYAIDFIADKWRTIRTTRCHGLIQLSISVPSLAYLIFYIILQIKHEDYKEAAAAIAVAVFNSYHVLRTVWGLIQLYEFRNWNIYALQCLLQMGYSAPTYDYSNGVKDLFSGPLSWVPFRKLAPPAPSNANSTTSQSGEWSVLGFCTGFQRTWKNVWKRIFGIMEVQTIVPCPSPNLSLDDVKRTVDRHMIVNSSLLDNEFSNVEVPVWPSFGCRVLYDETSRHSATARVVASLLKSGKPEECSIRWLVSFLAKFGSRWLTHTRGLSTRDSSSPMSFSHIRRDAAQDLGLLAALHTTHGAVEETGSTETFVSVCEPLHSYCVAPAGIRTSVIEITERCMLPFKMQGYEGGENTKTLFDFAKYESVIRNAAKDDWHKASLNTRNTAERSAIKNVSAVQLACFSTIMENIKFSGEDDWEPLKIVHLGSTSEVAGTDDPRVATLMYQLGYDTEKDCEQFFQELPIRKEFLTSLLWSREPNRLLFQTSVHVDNLIALEAGDRLDLFLKERSTPGARETRPSVFQTQFDLEICCFRSAVGAVANDMFLLTWENARFIGCVAETVRSILAKWVEKNQDLACIQSGWDVRAPSFSVRFRCSKQLATSFADLQKVNLRNRYGHTRSLCMRLLWEFQAYLQHQVVNESDDTSQDIRESPFLILLFILGFPALKMEELADSYALGTVGNRAIAIQNTFSVVPVGAPQIVNAVFSFDDKSATVSATFHGESPRFKWQEWKDSLVARLSAKKHWRLTRLSSKNEDFREEGNNTVLSSPVRCISKAELELRFELTFWSGWPPNSYRFAHFEMAKLCTFYKNHFSSFPSYAQCDPHTFVGYIGNLNAAMDRYTYPRSVPKSLYDEGLRALSKGYEEDALRIFGRSIADHGSAAALRKAVDFVLGKRPVSMSQVFAVRAKMVAWLLVLVNQGSNMEPSGQVIDLHMLAHYFGRLYETTRNVDAFRQKVLALFHTNGSQNAVNVAAIESCEAFITAEPSDIFCHHLSCYLAIAHQSHFQKSGNPADRELAAKYIFRLGSSPWTANEHVVVSIGYLLEKGFFVSRDSTRKDSLLSFTLGNGGWGDTERMQAMFERLFVKSEDRVRNADTGFGTGRHPLDAITVYKSLQLKSDGSNEIYYSQALNRLGLLYHIGLDGAPTNKEEARRRYFEAIRHGNIDALCNIAVLEAPDQSHISNLKRAVDARSTNAMNNLAIAYELGSGVDRDVLEAQRLYEQAIALDSNPLAMYNLAVFHKRENWSKSDELLSALVQSDLDRLYSLQEQFANLIGPRNWDGELAPSYGIGVEELGDSLAYLKLLHH